MGHVFSRLKMPLVAAAATLLVSGAQAQEKVRIGVLNDQSGVFATYQGIGSVVAAQMAVEDFGGKAAGKVVEVVAADHQNKPDIGVAACAVTLTIIAGNFDLSLGSIFVLSEVLGAYAAVHWGVWWCFPVAIDIPEKCLYFISNFEQHEDCLLEL